MNKKIIGILLILGIVGLGGFGIFYIYKTSPQTEAREIEKIENEQVSTPVFNMNSTMDPVYIEYIEKEVNDAVEKKMNEYTNVFVTKENITNLLDEKTISKITNDTTKAVISVLGNNDLNLSDTQKAEVSEMISDSIKNISVSLKTEAGISDKAKKAIMSAVNDEINTLKEQINAALENSTNTTTVVENTPQPQYFLSAPTVETPQVNYVGQPINESSLLEIRGSIATNSVEIQNILADLASFKETTRTQMKTISAEQQIPSQATLTNIRDAIKKDIKENLTSYIDANAIENAILQDTETRLVDWLMKNYGEGARVPVKGVDYMTDLEIESIQNEIINQLYPYLQEQIITTIKETAELESEAKLSAEAKKEIEDEIIKDLTSQLKLTSEKSVTEAIDKLEQSVLSLQKDSKTFENSTTERLNELEKTVKELTENIEPKDNDVNKDYYEKTEKSIADIVDIKKDIELLKVSGADVDELNNKLTALTETVNTIQSTINNLAQNYEVINREIGSKDESSTIISTSIWAAVDEVNEKAKNNTKSIESVNNELQVVKAQIDSTDSRTLGHEIIEKEDNTYCLKLFE